MRHLRAFSQEAHGLHEPKLLPPFSKGHSEFLLEESFDGPFAGTTHSAKLSKRSTIAGVSDKYLCNPNQPWIRQMWQL
jgi:hypothetical protein